MKVKLITKTFPFLIRMNKNNVSLLSSLIIALKKCICKIIKTPSALEFTYKKKKGGKKKNKFTRTSTYSFAYSTDGQLNFNLYLTFEINILLLGSIVGHFFLKNYQIHQT